GLALSCRMYDRARVVPRWSIGHPGWVWVRVVGRGRNVSRCRKHHGRGRGHDGAEEGEPDPEGEVNPSAGLPACVLEVRGPSTWRTVCLMSSPEGERLGEGGGSVNFGRL